MHILLVRFSSMGDVVLQTATINWLRAQFHKNLRLTFVTSKEFGGLLRDHTGLDEIVIYDRKGGEEWTSLVEKVKTIHQKNHIDLIFDLHGTLRSLKLKFSLWWIPSLTVEKRRFERFLLTKIKIPFIKNLIRRKIFPSGPQVVRIIEDFESLFGGQLALWRTQEYRNGSHGELTSLSEQSTYDLSHPYVVLSPSASFNAKRWALDSYVELSKVILEKTNFHVVILAGPEDHFCRVFDEIQNERLKNLQGKTSISETMGILSKAKICIGNDSGLNHIAEAYGVPVITIFGPTDPVFGFYPHGNLSCYLYKQLWCSPCSTTGKKDCFRERHFCMDLITTEEVYRKFEQIVEKL